MGTIFNDMYHAYGFSLVPAFLQGGKYKRLKEEIQEYLSDLHLEDKINVPVSDLSGGMKRKLRCVCCTYVWIYYYSFNYYYCILYTVELSIADTLSAE